MNRENLVMLHAALGELLTWPPGVLDEIARWLAQAAKPNGHDPHPPNGKDLDPPPIASPSPRSTPYAGKSSTRAQPLRHVGPVDARTAERKLIAAMQASPGLSIAALANATDVSRSTMERRLQRLAAAGQIEKDHAGRWRPSSSKPLAEEARPARVEPHPPSPPL